MINWAELDEDFQAFAKDLQGRYDGKGSFLTPEEAAARDAAVGQGADDSAEEETVFAKVELTVSLGTPESPDGGMPVRFLMKSGEATGWAVGWLPSCAISASEGFGENELAFASSYLKDNASAIIEAYLGKQSLG